VRKVDRAVPRKECHFRHDRPHRNCARAVSEIPQVADGCDCKPGRLILWSCRPLSLVRHVFFRARATVTAGGGP